MNGAASNAFSYAAGIISDGPDLKNIDALNAGRIPLLGSESDIRVGPLRITGAAGIYDFDAQFHNDLLTFLRDPLPTNASASYFLGGTVRVGPLQIQGLALLTGDVDHSFFSGSGDWLARPISFVSIRSAYDVGIHLPGLGFLPSGNTKTMNFHSDGLGVNQLLPELGGNILNSF